MADSQRTTGAEESAVGIAPSPSANTLEPTSSTGHDIAINHGPILEAEAENSALTDDDASDRATVSKISR
ncbi:hypothetical protein HER10_EVM0001142 [Colletotrichum scovillei]|uniref:uncharacterized protein n=1 Tax=Colletotrichum scovillei TaxID=1209932 RepID=UPI0015C2DCB8|nr:uncharacterized protein HER10_EVM0001142 [Colletotrichum scovillei]KAF4774572.1 hypothetical protein HER10_EVM0001142 [Colletotrichum scovillei]